MPKKEYNPEKFRDFFLIKFASNILDYLNFMAAFPPSVPKPNEVVRRSQSFLPRLFPAAKKRISTQVGLQFCQNNKLSTTI
ncbi:hypothetical protein [Epilithonimonas sp. UC225_85]|uniref:hypothetical protein n=1 Tax=Epilithonimonas sp. UC225_85 TaxID=3350167 RepID=UPI0036D2598F